MSKDNKKLLLYLGLLLLALLLNYKLPHDSYSVIQYLIKPIRNDGGGVFYPSSLVLLGLTMIGLFGFVSLKRFERKPKIPACLFIMVIIIPLMKYSIDITRSIYYWISKDNLEAVDIEESNINLSSNNENLTLNIKLKLIDYGKDTNEFKFRVYLPEAMSEYAGIEVYESECAYVTHGNRQKLDIQESIVLKFDNEESHNAMPVSEWWYQDVTYELYNEVEVVKIIDHGL